MGQLARELRSRATSPPSARIQLGAGARADANGGKGKTPKRRGGIKPGHSQAPAPPRAGAPPADQPKLPPGLSDRARQHRLPRAPV